MNFPKISKEKWKARIETELRGKKSLHDLNYKIGNELSADLLLQESDRIENIAINVPEASSFGIYFEAVPDNKLIIEVLSKGASALYLSGNFSENWKDYLKGVHTNYIDLLVNDKKSIPQQSLKDLFSQKNTHELRSDRILNIADCIQSGKLIDTIRTLTENEGNIGFILNDSLMLNIVLLRAMRHILESHQPKIKIISLLSRGDESLEYQLIRFTAQAYAAINGGSDYVLFPVHHGCSPEDASKIIHISNVLSLESKLSRYKDPWRGAYSIEHLTHHIIKKVKGGH